MRKNIILTMLFISTFVCAENELSTIIETNNPPVAKVASYLEGIVEMHVREGQHVKKGQLLFKTNIDDQKINMKKNELAVWYYQNAYLRSKELYSKKASSLERFESDKLNYLKALQDVKTTELMINRSSYYSPFSGIVTDIIYYSGSAVGDGDDVLEITKIDKIHPEIKLKNKLPVAEVSSFITGIVDMHVKEGERVKKGQLIFNVTADFSKILREKKKIDIWYYKEKYMRSKKLHQNNVASLEEYETDKFNYFNSLLDLELSNILIGKTVYYAPFDGVVTKILHYNGSAVGDGNNVLSITKC